MAWYDWVESLSPGKYETPNETMVDVQDGAPKIAKLPYKWLNSMVYGRYNYSIHRVYKPNITGRHHPVGHETTYLWGGYPWKVAGLDLGTNYNWLVVWNMFYFSIYWE